MSRYGKGTINLNFVRDGELLRHLHNCGFLTRAQLFQLVTLGATERNLPSMTNRLRRLIDAGYIGITYDPQVPGKKIYFCSEKSDDVLITLGEHKSSRDVNEGVRNLPEDPSNVVHSVFLAALKIKMAEQDLLESWESEASIRSRNDSMKQSYVKDYDAVIEFRQFKHLKIAIEYERTRKSRARYKQICHLLSEEPYVHGLLYITADLHTTFLLRDCFADAKLPVAVINYSEIMRHLLAVRVMAQKDLGRILLTDFLTPIFDLENKRRANLLRPNLRVITNNKAAQ